jgi:hypothetical protein
VNGARGVRASAAGAPALGSPDSSPRSVHPSRACDAPHRGRGRNSTTPHSRSRRSRACAWTPCSRLRPPVRRRWRDHPSSLVGHRLHDRHAGSRFDAIFYESPGAATCRTSVVGRTEQTQVNERLRLQATTALGIAPGPSALSEGQRSLMSPRTAALGSRCGRIGQRPPTCSSSQLGRDADASTSSPRRPRQHACGVNRGPRALSDSTPARPPAGRLHPRRYDGIGLHGVDRCWWRGSLQDWHRASACEDAYGVHSRSHSHFNSPPCRDGGGHHPRGSLRERPPLPGDTAEVWVNEIRLADLVNSVGVAGEVSATLSAGELGSLRLSLRRRDPNFRQIAEAPSFLTNDDLDLSATWRLDRVLPRELGLAIPLTLSHRARVPRVEPVRHQEAIDASHPGCVAARDQRAAPPGPVLMPQQRGCSTVCQPDGTARSSSPVGRSGFDIANTGFFNLGGCCSREPPNLIPWFGEAARLRIAPSYVRITSAVAFRRPPVVVARPRPPPIAGHPWPPGGAAVAPTSAVEEAAAVGHRAVGRGERTTCATTTARHQ